MPFIMTSLWFLSGLHLGRSSSSSKLCLFKTRSDWDEQMILVSIHMHLSINIGTIWVAILLLPRVYCYTLSMLPCTSCNACSVVLIFAARRVAAFIWVLDAIARLVLFAVDAREFTVVCLFNEKKSLKFSNVYATLNSGYQKPQHKLKIALPFL